MEQEKLKGTLPELLQTLDILPTRRAGGREIEAIRTL